MIITRIKGGLGNQMFQYAIARRISLDQNCDFKLDITDYNADNFRKFGLKNFNIVENIATSEEVKKLKYPYGFLSKMWRFFSFKILRIHNVGFNASVLQRHKDLYLDGYWQSYKYYENIRKKLQEDFSLKIPLTEEKQRLVEEIRNCNAVSLHIRRGDYVSDKNASKIFNVCTMEYFESGAEYIGSKVASPIFYIFSDDANWVKENLKINFPTVYVADYGLKDFEELYLMSCCKHNVIANSSFSWWGAWLNNNPDKIVVCPKKWVNNNSVKMGDLVPDNWVRV